jgi:hypothetical protein
MYCNLNAPAITSTYADHPTERTLRRLAANEVGQQRKRKLAVHLDDCCECRLSVAKFREVSRRFRDLEKIGLSQFANIERAAVAGE